MRQTYTVATSDRSHELSGEILTDGQREICISYGPVGGKQAAIRLNGEAFDNGDALQFFRWLAECAEDVMPEDGESVFDLLSMAADDDDEDEDE